MILLAEHDEPPLTAKKKRRLGASSRPTSTPKNRVWGFESIPSGRPGADLDLSWENAIGSVQFTYETASGRAGWLSRDPIGENGGINLYEYVRNNTINLIDPLGLCGCPNSSNGCQPDQAIQALKALVQAGYDVLNFIGWQTIADVSYVAAIPDYADAITYGTTGQIGKSIEQSGPAGDIAVDSGSEALTGAGVLAEGSTGPIGGAVGLAGTFNDQISDAGMNAANAGNNLVNQGNTAINNSYHPASLFPGVNLTNPCP